METNIKNRDSKMWKLAKKRVGFKSHLFSYVMVNILLWVIWWITLPEESVSGSIPWPVWPLIGWGLGLTFHYVFTYLIQYDEKDFIEKEYKKMKHKNMEHNTL